MVYDTPTQNDTRKSTSQFVVILVSASVTSPKCLKREALLSPCVQTLCRQHITAATVTALTYFPGSVIVHMRGQKCTRCVDVWVKWKKHTSSVCYTGTHFAKVRLHGPDDRWRDTSHDTALEMRLTDVLLCTSSGRGGDTLSIRASTCSQPLFFNFKTKPFKQTRLGLGRRDRLSEGRQGCFRDPITYALKNFSLAAIIQELLLARQGMGNRKRDSKESQMVD